MKSKLFFIILAIALFFIYSCSHSTKTVSISHEQEIVTVVDEGDQPEEIDLVNSTEPTEHIVERAPETKSTIIEETIPEEPVPDDTPAPNKVKGNRGIASQTPSVSVKKQEEVPQNIVEPKNTEPDVHGQSSSVSVDSKNSDAKKIVKNKTVYEARMKAPKTIYWKNSGNMIVWISDIEHRPVETLNDAKNIGDSAEIPAKKGQYARITPFAPNFKVTPNCDGFIITSKAQKAVFNLAPIDSLYGEKQIVVKIELFTDQDCIGEAIWKDAEILKVVVTVNHLQSIRIMVEDIFVKLVENIRILVISIMGAFCAYLIFKFRKKLGLEKEKEDTK